MIYVVVAMLAIYALGITLLWWRLKTQAADNVDAMLELQLLKRSHRGELPLSPSKTAAWDAAQDEPEIIDKANEAMRLHQTFQKFVPRQFVDHFDKGGADKLALGYADEDEVAVMFCDIRGFTGLSERLSPQELMNFLNSYFLRMNAPIHANNGFIDKFIGDAIMALFDHPTGSSADKAADAVRAALDLQKALRLYNDHRTHSGYHTIKNGIGLHIGPVVIGTVGSDDRMDTTVIGDSVNITQRIEAMTEQLNVDILASRDLCDAAYSTFRFAHRLVDNIVLKGKTTSIELIEIFEHESSDEIARKKSTASIIKKGIALRESKKYEQALALFNKAYLQHQDDKVFAHHIDVCQKLLN